MGKTKRVTSREAAWPSSVGRKSLEEAEWQDDRSSVEDSKIRELQLQTSLGPFGLGYIHIQHWLVSIPPPPSGEPAQGNH